MPRSSRAVEQQGGRELLCTAWSRIINPRMPSLKLPDMLSQAPKRPQGSCFDYSSSDVNRTSRPVERTGSAETILKEAHLASYPLVMLCLGSLKTRLATVDPVQTDNLRI
ncbi:hypothetical protein ABIA00_003436 [Bradyrhizobium ottawaense]|uniref:hypothetical protein n=1 Tax=Bradyrhizobium ottawaense TaxID=931866 RepID=UPI003836D9D5